MFAVRDVMAVVAPAAFREQDVRVPDVVALAGSATSLSYGTAPDR
ncbi:hypothetical protein [Streptomyces xantholiticus]|nr:hypothetical protein [Streptomyces xantholiticus]